MKKMTPFRSILLLSLLIVLLTSCEKEYLVPASELPKWLKENIQEHEQSIKEESNPTAAIAAWKRTTWKKEYYYEYFNPILSSMPRPISHSGDTLHVFVGESSSDYHQEKCCSVYVWKGPDFIEIH